MSTPFTGRHPSQDELADLAAEALPAAEARAVEAHVMACPACEQLLADAELVRALLTADDPGPMPDDVWHRLEASIAVEVAQRRSAPGGRSTQASPYPPGESTQASPYTSNPAAATPPGGRTGSWFDPPPPTTDIPVRSLPVPSPPPELSFAEAPTAAWKAFLDEPEPAPAAPAAVPLRVGRAVRSLRSRRDVRTEDRAARRRLSPAVLAAAAVAVVAVVGIGGFGLRTMLGGDDSASVDALPGAGSRSIVHNSGVEYTAATLAQQVKALVATGSPVPSPSRTGAASASARSSTSAPAATASADQAGTVADPKVLASCLTAIGAGTARPLAIDLARYQGREAAILVLARPTGGYDVWVVSRTCRPGAEGTLAFKAVPA